MPMEKPFIFISYKTEERSTAQRIRQALATSTAEKIWWDQDLQTGGQWNEDLDEAVRNAACIVVLWSNLSVESDWVQQEAAIGKAADKLVPARLDDCDIPLPYRQIQTANLRDWDGNEKHLEFQKISNAVKKLVNAQELNQTSIDSAPLAEDTNYVPKKWWLSLLLPATMATATLALVYLQFATTSELQNVRCLTTTLREISASQVKRDILLLQREALLDEQRVLLESPENNLYLARQDSMFRHLKSIDEALAREREESDKKTDILSREKYCDE